MRVIRAATFESKGMHDGPKKQYKKERSRRVRRAAKQHPEMMPQRMGNSYGIGGFGS